MQSKQQKQTSNKNESSSKDKKNNQPNKEVKFNRQIILKYIQKQKSQIAALRAYFSSRFNQQKNISQSINAINAELQNFFLRERSEIQNKKKKEPTIKDKKVLECLKNFSTNQKQSQICAQNAQIISENILKWIEQVSKQLNSIQQPLKQIQRKSIKKILTQKEIDEFKVYLKSQMVKFKHEKDLIMEIYSTQIMKGDCEMISVLSFQIQKYKQWITQ